MAFQMQASVPDLVDVRGESASTLARYGCEPGDGTFASNCLLARRLAERGVRFFQLYHRDWDHHSLLKEELPLRAADQVVTVHDLHATMLERLGIQHDAFSVKFQGLDARLSGVEGAKVIGEILG